MFYGSEAWLKFHCYPYINRWCHEGHPAKIVTSRAPLFTRNTSEPSSERGARLWNSAHVYTQVAEQVAAELRERERRAQQEQLERDRSERELAQKQKEEQKQRELEWAKHTAQLKKRQSTIDDKYLDSWTTYTYAAMRTVVTCIIDVILHRR